MIKSTRTTQTGPNYNNAYADLLSETKIANDGQVKISSIDEKCLISPPIGQKPLYLSVLPKNGEGVFYNKPHFYHLFARRYNINGAKVDLYARLATRILARANQGGGTVFTMILTAITELIRPHRTVSRYGVSHVN